MNRFNQWLVMLILPLLVIHGLLGCFALLGIAFITFWPLSYTLLLVVVLHGIIGLLLTRNAVKIGLQTKHWYWKTNARYWVVRLSGICILILLGLHTSTYTAEIHGVSFLQEFTFLRMLSQLLLITAIAVHLLAAARPWLIKRGVFKFGERTRDCIVVLGILTAFFTFSIVMYYIYWNF